MRYAIIEPATDTVRDFECEDTAAAIREAGLKLYEVDHGAITPHLGIIVYEFGLFDPPHDQAYFCVDGRLYSGNAVVYGVGDQGETVDAMKAHALASAFRWFHGQESVERAIRAGSVMRPCMTLNGELTWQWPDKAPFELPEKKHA